MSRRPPISRPPFAAACRALAALAAIVALALAGAPASLLASPGVERCRHAACPMSRGASPAAPSCPMHAAASRGDALALSAHCGCGLPHAPGLPHADRLAVFRPAAALAAPLPARGGLPPFAAAPFSGPRAPEPPPPRG